MRAGASVLAPSVMALARESTGPAEAVSVPAQAADDQYTVEAYFRFQATKTTGVTPNFQLLIQPASNPGADVIAVFGSRVRFNF